MSYWRVFVGSWKRTVEHDATMTIQPGCFDHVRCRHGDARCQTPSGGHVKLAAHARELLQEVSYFGPVTRGQRMAAAGDALRQGVDFTDQSFDC